MTFFILFNCYINATNVSVPRIASSTSTFIAFILAKPITLYFFARSNPCKVLQFISSIRIRFWTTLYILQICRSWIINPSACTKIC